MKHFPTPPKVPFQPAGFLLGSRAPSLIPLTACPRVPLPRMLCHAASMPRDAIRESSCLPLPLPWLPGPALLRNPSALLRALHGSWHRARVSEKGTQGWSQATCLFCLAAEVLIFTLCLMDCLRFQVGLALLLPTIPPGSSPALEGLAVASFAA